MRKVCCANYREKAFDEQRRPQPVRVEILPLENCSPTYIDKHLSPAFYTTKAVEVTTPTSRLIKRRRKEGLPPLPSIGNWRFSSVRFDSDLSTSPRRWSCRP